MLRPCTVLVFDSFTLYLYICNNNYLTTELVLYFDFYVSVQYMLSAVLARGELPSCSSPGLVNYPGQPVLGFDNTSVSEYIKDLL